MPADDTTDPENADRGLGRRVWTLFDDHHGTLAAILTAVVLTSGLGIITPFLTQAAFDRALFPPAASWTSRCWPGSSPA
ncbi:hypothetical protein [Pseudonocardia sp. T1-2H]|uniref:hypothetical protein n=1 Tax=Pseudonocardia sp. T1-2H TaxID=3128899 RepID=UPI003100D3B4